jgi:hypothetical protein
MARLEASLVTLALATLPVAGLEAQVYTRRNANGVVEATNVPDSRVQPDLPSTSSTRAASSAAAPTGRCTTTTWRKRPRSTR